MLLTSTFIFSLILSLNLNFLICIYTNTKEVAQQWAQMCREGKNAECVEALYCDNVTSKEMPGLPNEIVNGKQSVITKNQQ